jgi:hypothetical protein
MNYKDTGFKNSIIQAINNKKLVLFVGAGFSKLCGLPLWGELSSALMDSCVKEGLINYSERHQIVQEKDSRSLITIAYYLFKRENKTDLFYKVFDNYLSIENYNSQTDKNNRDKLKDLIKRSHATILTTNSDNILHDCFVEDFIHYTEDDLKMFELTDERNLVHLHGFKEDKNSLVFTTDQYLRRYASTKFKQSIQKIFRSDSTILFIGYGLNELQFLDFLVNTDSISSNRFVLEGFFDYAEADINAKEIYYQTFGLKLITFSKNDKGFEGMIDALEYLVEEAEKTSNARSETYNCSIKLFNEKPSKEKANSLKNNLLVMSDIEQDSLINNLFKSRFASNWIIAMEKWDIGVTSFFSINNKLKPGLKVESGYQGVDFSGLRSLADICKQNKDNIALFRIGKSKLMEILDAFEINNALYSNFYIVGVIQRWIFSDYRLMNLEKSFNFVTKSEKSEVHFSRDWITWIYYETDELLLCNKKMLLKYVKAVINLNINNQRNYYEFDSFVKKYGKELSKKHPNEVFSLLLNIIQEKAKEKYWFFLENNASLIQFKNSNPENHHSEDDVLIYWFLLSLDNLEASSIKQMYMKWKKSKCKFFRKLTIYLVDEYFSIIREIFFSDTDNPLNNWDVFSDIYLLIKKHSSDFSKEETNILSGWIKAMKVNRISDLYNQVNKIDLLKALAVQNPESMVIKNFIDQIQSNFTDEEKNQLSSFPAPEFRNRNFWSTSYSIVDDEEFNKQLRLSDARKFVDLISGELTENQVHSVNTLFNECATKVNLFDWLRINSFENLMMLPKKYLFKVIDFVFEQNPHLSFQTISEFYFKCFDLVDDQDKSEVIRRTMNGIYYSYLKLIDDGDFETHKSIANFIKDELRVRKFSWLDSSTFSQKGTYHTLLYREIYCPIGILIRTSYILKEDFVTQYLSEAFVDSNKAMIAKGITAAHIGFLWNINSNWVKENIKSIFDNNDGENNFSVLGYLISGYHYIEFVNLLNETGLLKMILNSDDFKDAGSVFIYNVLINYDGKAKNEDVLKTILASKFALGALHIYADKIKDVSNFPKYEERINLIFKVASETDFGDKGESGYAIERLLKVFNLFGDKTYIWKLIICLLDRHKIYNIEEITGYLSTQAGITNDMAIEFVEKYTDRLSEHYLYMKEIVKLVNVPDWSNNASQKQEVINKLGKINPDFYKAFTYDHNP